MRTLVTLILSIFFCTVGISQDLPYQKMKTPYEFEYIKGGKKVFVPDTAFSLSCNDTNRIAIVGQSVIISYRDGISGCAKWFLIGDVSSYFSSFIRSQYSSKEVKSFWAQRGRLDTLYMDGTIYTSPTQLVEPTFSKYRTLIQYSNGTAPFVITVQDSSWNGTAWVPNTSFGLGFNSLFRNKGIFSYGGGQEALYLNTANYANGWGYRGGWLNSGIYASFVGAFSLYLNSGTEAYGGGAMSGYLNIGNFFTGSGARSGYQNRKDGLTTSGWASALQNAGAWATISGYFGGYTNTGDSLTSTGTYSGYRNNWKNRTSYGAGAGGKFTDNNTTLKTVTSANINTATKRATISGHSFGAADKYVNLRFKVVSGTAPTNMETNGIYQFKIIDANTLESADYFSNAGSGTFTFNLDSSKNGATEIGWNANAEKDNQVMIGGTNVTEMKTPGIIVAKANNYTVGGYRQLVRNELTGAFETVSKDSIISYPVSILLPSNLYAVEGVEFNIYFDNIIRSELPVNDLELDVTCTKGAHYSKFFRYLPVAADSGTTSFKLDVYYRGLLLATKTVNLNTTKSSSGSGDRNVILFGDSQIDSDYLTDSLEINYSSNPLNIVTQGYYITPVGNRNNGRGGWRYIDYSTFGRTFYIFTVSGVTTTPSIDAVYSDGTRTYRLSKVTISGGSGNIQGEQTGTGSPAASGTLTRLSGTGDATISYSAVTTGSGNPLWNVATGTVEMSKYLSDNSITLTSGDWIFWQLGTNDVFGWDNDTRVTDTAVSVKKYIDTLIASIRRVSSTIRIGIVLPPVGSDQDAFGVRNANVQNYKRYNKNIKLLMDYLIASLDNTTYQSNNIYVLAANPNYDAVYNSQKMTIQVNAKNSATVQISSNDVHPGTSGYSQLADTYYGIIKWFK